MKNSKFDIDLAKGQEMEETFKEFMKGSLVEVKSERHIWEKTGNHFVEFECRGKESGIKVTKAKYFVTYFPYLQEAWFILTNKLKKLINDNELPITTDAGDEKSGTKGYLINRELYKEHFKILNVNHKWEN